MIIAETKRLRLRKFSIKDAEFILKLVNEPSWLQYIGDRGVHSLDDARNYILSGPVASYNRFGFGLYRVELKDNKNPIGMCGLLKRDALEDVDIGFAYLPEYQGQGYAFEAASAVVALGKKLFGLIRIAAITDPENSRSIRLLEKLGFQFNRMIRLDPDDIELKLYISF